MACFKEGKMKKITKPSYTVHVHRDVVFEVAVPADTIKEALEKAEQMTVDELWAGTGDIIDDTHKITAVFA